jgi:hypothetical protein
MVKASTKTPASKEFFKKGTVIGTENGIPIVKSTELKRLGVPVPMKNTNDKKTEKASRSEKSNRSERHTERHNKSEKQTKSEKQSPERPTTPYGVFQEAFKRYRASHKALNLTGEQKKTAWNDLKVLVESTGEDRVKPTLKGFTQYFDSIWS